MSKLYRNLGSCFQLKVHNFSQLDKPDDQVELLRHIIRHDLTVKQIRDIIEKGTLERTNSDDYDIPRLPRSVMQIAKFALKPTDEVDAYSIAQAFVGLERDRTVAKARLQALRVMLERAEKGCRGQVGGVAGDGEDP